MSGEGTIYVREVLPAPYSVRGRHHHGIALGLLYPRRWCLPKDTL